MDNIVRPEHTRQMIADSYRHFDDVEPFVLQEVFNGVWNAPSDGRMGLTIGTTRVIPVGGRHTFRDMGMLSWSCVAISRHPPTLTGGPFSGDTLRSWPPLIYEDTSRTLPKRVIWLLDNQKRVVVLDWESSAACISAGLCIGMVPTHFAKPQLNEGRWVALELESPLPDSARCLTQQQNDISPALTWLLECLGDSEALNKEWLREPGKIPTTGD